MKLIRGSSPRKKQALSPYPSDFLQNFKIVQPSPVNYFLKKLAPHPFKKEEEGTDQKA